MNSYTYETKHTYSNYKLNVLKKENIQFYNTTFSSSSSLSFLASLNLSLLDL